MARLTRNRQSAPQPLHIAVRAYRIGTAKLAYDSCGDDTRRLTNAILDSLFGMDFKRLVREIESYNEEREDVLTEVGSEAESGQGEPELAEAQSP